MTNQQIELIKLGNLIEIEMKKIGIWKNGLTFIENSSGPFGGTEMKFEEWLQVIFLPKLLISVNSNSFPKKSQVVIAAIRNFDGMDEADILISLLGRVDEIINTHVNL
jgi:uncharacterized protein YqcC (DUF446 family)